MLLPGSEHHSAFHLSLKGMTNLQVQQTFRCIQQPHLAPALQLQPQQSAVTTHTASAAPLQQWTAGSLGSASRVR